MNRKYNATPEEISFYEDDIAFSTPQNQETLDRQISFYEDVDNPAQALPENLPWYQSIPNAIGKGLLNGLQQFGQAFGPLPQDNTGMLIEYLKQQGGEGAQQQTFEEYAQQNQKPSFGETLNQLLPTNEGFAENTIARAGNILPFLLTGNFGGVGKVAGQTLAEGAQLSSGPLKEVLIQGAKDLISPLGRALGAGASGAAAESYGAPEWLQSLAEIPAQLTPSFRSKILPNKAQQPLVEQARNLGLAEKEIAPLIQSERKQKVLGLVASRSGKTQENLSNSYDAVGRVYGQLSNRPEAKQILNTNQSNKVISEIQSRISNMPSQLRNTISTDLTDLVNEPITGKSLINFYQDVNYYVGKGDKQLGLLKEPIIAGLAQLSPKLANDFNMTNKLYSNYHLIAKNLKPSITSDLIEGSEALRLLYGTFTGNFPLILETVGEGAARKAASQLLVNPRFQNLSKQMVQALNQSKFGVAQRILNPMIELAAEKAPEVAAKLQQVNLNKFQSNQQRDSLGDKQ